jgi:hypothetical protein
MKNFSLLTLLTEAPTECGTNPALSINQREFASKDSAYHYWKVENPPSQGGTLYYRCKKKSAAPVVNPDPAPVGTKKCPNEEGYDIKEFQDWLDSQKIAWTSSGGQLNKGTGYGNCGDKTQAAWKTYREKFIEYKKGNQQPSPDPVVQQDTEQQKIEKCKAQNLVYDKATDACVAPVQEVDPDVQKLKDEMEVYRTILNSFTDTSGWMQLDTLTPNKYTPNNLNIDLLDGVTAQIVELIENKGSSSDFGLFIKMLTSIKDAYNVDKYKDFFQKKVDPKGQDIFGKIDGLINNINTAANEYKNGYGYNPLTKPTEKQIREFVFRGQLRSVYKVGKVNLMMDVYTYTKGVPLEDGGDKEVTSEIKSYLDAVKTNLNFNTCKDILSVYRSTYNKKVYTVELFTGIKKQIQKCWCNKHYEDLGKLGTKNMFNKEMRKDRKELITFLNSLGGAQMGDYAIGLNDSVCSKIKISK